MPVEFQCPACSARIDQTVQNRMLPRIECPKCKAAFRTQWASSPADLALPFPQRQQKMLAGLARSEAELSRAAGATAAIPWTALLEPFLRMAPAALALAGGFFVVGYGSRGGRTEVSNILEKEQSYFDTLGKEPIDRR